MAETVSRSQMKLEFPVLVGLMDEVGEDADDFLEVFSRLRSHTDAEGLHLTTALVQELLARWVELRVAAPHEPELADAAVNMHRSLKALGAAAAAVKTPMSPELARSVQATENYWRKIEAEFGLLTSLEVSEAVGSATPNRSFASDQRKAGKLIAIQRPGGLRYPGFQLDRGSGMVRPVMEDLIGAARAAGRTEPSLALWMITPTGYLDGFRPVDRIAADPASVIDAARQSFNVEW